MHSLLLAVLAFLQAGTIQLPQPTGLVNDFAHVLSPEAVQRMEHIAEQVRQKSRGEMAIVTLPSLQGRDVAEVALQIGRQWKVGKLGDPGDPTRNAGAVILLVPKETSDDGRGYCRIETGRGAEGFITDADAGDICREATAPFFAKRDYSDGLLLVTYRVAQRFANEFNFALDTGLVQPELTQQPSQPSRGGGIPPFVWLILFFVIISLLSGGRGGRRGGCGGCIPIFIPWGGFGGGGRGGWGGGGFGGGGGGGFGGFGGGGGFSGGGGGSNW